MLDEDLDLKGRIADVLECAHIDFDQKTIYVAHTKTGKPRADSNEQAGRSGT